MAKGLPKTQILQEMLAESRRAIQPASVMAAITVLNRILRN
jgi:hypothetical protein